MKKIYSLIIIFLLSFIVNVSADTLVIDTNNVSNNNLLVDIKVKDSTRNNNVYEGIISYDDKKINNFNIVQDTGWEVYTKKVENGIKFMVFSMDFVAINDTVLFRISMNYKDIANLGINSVNSANGVDGINLSNVNYSYKQEIVTPPVDNNVNNNPTPVIPEDVTNNVEPEIKDEEVVPDKEEIKEDEEAEEQYEAVVEQEKTPWWLALLIIVIVVLAGIYVGFKKVPGGDR